MAEHCHHERPAAAFERFNQCLLGERLCKKRDAPRLQRGRANGRVFISGNVNDRHGNAISLKLTPPIDARSVLQVDV